MPKPDPQTAELTRLKGFLNRILEWDAQYPKSALHMTDEQIVASELALDDILMEIREAMQGQQTRAP